MLSLEGSRARLCDGIHRREVLRAGGLGLFGLTLPELLRAREASASTEKVHGNGKAKSCILLFLMGGPPQHSTWDPKPDAPAEVRGEFKHIPSIVPGINICE